MHHSWQLRKLIPLFLVTSASIRLRFRRAAPGRRTCRVEGVAPLTASDSRVVGLNPWGDKRQATATRLTGVHVEQEKAGDGFDVGSPIAAWWHDHWGRLGRLRSHQSSLFCYDSAVWVDGWICATSPLALSYDFFPPEFNEMYLARHQEFHNTICLLAVFL